MTEGKMEVFIEVRYWEGKVQDAFVRCGKNRGEIFQNENDNTWYYLEGMRGKFYDTQFKGYKSFWECAREVEKHLERRAE